MPYDVTVPVTVIDSRPWVLPPNPRDGWRVPTSSLVPPNTYTSNPLFYTEHGETFQLLRGSRVKRCLEFCSDWGVSKNAHAYALAEKVRRRIEHRYITKGQALFVCRFNDDRKSAFYRSAARYLLDAWHGPWNVKRKLESALLGSEIYTHKTAAGDVDFLLSKTLEVHDDVLVVRVHPTPMNKSWWPRSEREEAADRLLTTALSAGLLNTRTVCVPRYLRGAHVALGYEEMR